MKIVDWIFPPRCPLCGDVLALDEGRVHKKCYEKLPWIKEPRCKRCGKPVSYETVQWCADCFRNIQKYGRSFDEGRALWLYSGDIQKSLMAYKYNGLKSYGDFYGEMVVKVMGEWILRRNPEALIPVPLHSKKKRIRGFNQAELLARKIGKQMDIPVNCRILYRNRWTEPQKAISGRERRHNLAKSMEIREYPTGLKRIMLVDDIYTTGSTMEVCSRMLKEAGAETVNFLTLCVGQGEG